MGFVGITFGICVLTFYGYFKYISDSDSIVGRFLWIALSWGIFYMVYLLLFIYTAHRVFDEVSYHYIKLLSYFELNSNRKKCKTFGNYFQGKRKFAGILHEIINNCDDSNTASMV